MRATLAAAGLLVAGCYAAPPPPAVVTQLDGCHPGSFAVRSPLRCASDDDCLLCRTPDEPCGALLPRDRAELENRACARVSRTCHAAPACCDGRCVVSAGPPPL